jgi:hypothetical protein
MKSAICAPVLVTMVVAPNDVTDPHLTSSTTEGSV